MESTPRARWKRAMEGQSTLILLSSTFSAINSRQARPQQLQPIGAKMVYKTKYNPDGSTQYKACGVIKGYVQMDFDDI
jgi:hypothetical protein